MSRLFALFLAVLALGLVAGCGDDDDDGGGGGGAETTEQPGEDDSGAPEVDPRLEDDTGGGTEVGMKGIKFDPEDVTVKVNGTVKWTNNEAVPHDVTKEDGPGADFSSGKGNMNEGDTYSRVFTEAGTINYVCSVHPNMTGTVTVE